MTTKCPSNGWGSRHKFSPRYDLSAAQPCGDYKGPAGGMLLILEAQRTKTYVCDVCEYCGETIERKKP